MQKHWDNPREHGMPGEARVPAGFRIGTIDVTPATVLAPMVGVTDTVFRRFIRNASVFSSMESHVSEARHGAPGSVALDPTAPLRVDDGAPGLVAGSVEDVVTNQQSGCGLLMTEFTSADGLSRMRESKRKRYLTYYDDEHPISAQLFGSDPRTLADAARIVEDAGFDIVDLNLGCPGSSDDSLHCENSHGLE
jgi:tRNA-dihydrouridine synthase B